MKNQRGKQVTLVIKSEQSGDKQSLTNRVCLSVLPAWFLPSSFVSIFPYMHSIRRNNQSVADTNRPSTDQKVRVRASIELVPQLFAC